MPSISEMREVSQLRRPDAKGRMVWDGTWIERLVTRRYSIYISWLFVKLGLSANAATFLVIGGTIGGVALMASGNVYLNILATLLLIVGHTMDCVDGEIARWQRKASYRGWFFDLCSHVMSNATVAAICGLHLYARTANATYLLLAVSAYFAKQIELGFEAAARIVMLNYAAKYDAPQDAAPTSNGPGRRGLLVTAARYVYHIGMQKEMILILSIAAVFVGHAWTTWPLIVLTWGFGTVLLARALLWMATAYFRQIPSDAHVKKLPAKRI